MTKVRVRRGKNELAELVEVKSIVLGAVILAHNVLNILDARIQELLGHEIVKLANVDAAVSAAVQVLE